MKQFEILYNGDGEVEIMDSIKMVSLVEELENFDRMDVSQIHELQEDGEIGQTIWTEEEGLLVPWSYLFDLEP